MYQLVLLALLVQALVSRVDAQFAGFEDDESPRRTGWTTPRAGAAEDESLTPKYSSKPEPKAEAKVAPGARSASEASPKARASAPTAPTSDS